jgi:hypothetical protein
MHTASIRQLDRSRLFHIIEDDLVTTVTTKQKLGLEKD